MPHSYACTLCKPHLNVLTSSSSTSLLNWKKPRVRSSSTPFSDNGAAMASTLRKKKQIKSQDRPVGCCLGLNFPAKNPTNQRNCKNQYRATSSGRNVSVCDEIALDLFNTLETKASSQTFPPWQCEFLPQHLDQSDQHQPGLELGCSIPAYAVALPRSLFPSSEN